MDKDELDEAERRRLREKAKIAAMSCMIYLIIYNTIL